MRNYCNLDSLWLTTLTELAQAGQDQQTSRDGDVSGEQIGFSAVLRYPLNNVLLNPVRRFSLSYACAEVLWYLSGTNDIEMIKAYAPHYERFAEDGHAYGAYGHRWSQNPGWVLESVGYGFKSQLDALVNLLDAKPESRQAVLAMWDSGDLIHAIAGDHKDLPCTLAVQFLIRNEHLHCVATMRSNDVWLGLPYDVFAFTTLQAILAQELNLGLGTYTHQAGSEHLYTRNRDKALEAARYTHEADCYPGMLHFAYDNIPVMKDIGDALEVERTIRVKQTIGCQEHNILSLHPILRDLVLGAAMKWTAFSLEDFSNPIYRLIAERAYREAGYKTGSRSTD